MVMIKRPWLNNLLLPDSKHIILLLLELNRLSLLHVWCISMQPGATGCNAGNTAW